jgi:hypothetical protein
MRRSLVTALATTGLALVLCGTAAAKQGDPNKVAPSPPDQANALAFGAAGAPNGGSTVQQVSPAEALAAASVPGTDVEVPPGLSLDQAVGLAPTDAGAAGADGAAATLATAATYCWSNTMWGQWGIWPYQQRVNDNTYWCAVYGQYITYRSTHVTWSTTLCDGGDAWSFKINGGVGYSWVQEQSGAHFSCPTAIPWITIHTSRWIDVSRNAWGSAAVTAQS